MPKDAKLGLVVGVGLVIAFAVLSFRKDPNLAPAAGNVRTSPPSPGSAVIRPQASALPGLPPVGRSHTVLEGETLCSLAVRYYGDPARSSFLYHANQDRIRAPDHVPIGTVLVIPELPAELASGRSHP
jgi:nucleoid-associated protein YgaU